VACSGAPGPAPRHAASRPPAKRHLCTPLDHSRLASSSPSRAPPICEESDDDGDFPACLCLHSVASGRQLVSHQRMQAAAVVVVGILHSFGHEHIHIPYVMLCNQPHVVQTSDAYTSRVIRRGVPCLTIALAAATKYSVDLLYLPRLPARRLHPRTPHHHQSTTATAARTCTH
jgi:hypothetical protein